MKTATARTSELPKDSQAKEYRKPFNPFVGRGSKQTELLYALEEKRDDAFRAAALQLGKVLGLTDFWKEMLPEAIFSMLDHWDRAASKIAAVAFLERNGERQSAASISVDRAGLHAYADSIHCNWEFGLDCKDCSESPVYVYFRDMATNEVKERIELSALSHVRISAAQTSES